MYSTCLYCHGRFGFNESVAHFPVGRRLAFDARRGRLWVVCQRCGRWNLTPIEERWEAVEECERLFRSTRLRVSTTNIGLARVNDRTTLVRIGEPQRPEMAAWRYGNRLLRRRRQYLMQIGGVTAAAGAIAAIGVLGPEVTVVGTSVLCASLHIGTAIASRRPSLRFAVRGKMIRISRHAIAHIQLRPDDESGYVFEVPYLSPGQYDPVTVSLGLYDRESPYRSVALVGKEAASLARLVLPSLNRQGANDSTLDGALSLLDGIDDLDDAFRVLALTARSRRRALWGHEVGGDIQSPPEHRLGRVAPAYRFALEMALHETDERLAMETELSELRRRWEEAEEIAAIADSLLTPGRDVSLWEEDLAASRGARGDGATSVTMSTVSKPPRRHRSGREAVQVYLSADDIALVNRLSADTGLSKAEIVRRGLKSLAREQTAGAIGLTPNR